MVFNELLASPDDFLIVVRRTDLENFAQTLLAGCEGKHVAPQAESKEQLTITEAVAYLNLHGCNMKKSSVYKYTMTKEIPFKRFGDRKLVFEKSELDQWMREKMNKMKDRITDSVSASLRGGKK